MVPRLSQSRYTCGVVVDNAMYVLTANLDVILTATGKLEERFHMLNESLYA